ncbi:DUF402 domain-containing protein [Mycoplasma sp. Ms02]|uniref:DUF402 domain-containing protein n=1 Tax=Mycoplasma sp. Ms02 TaxID=353851 RepID=UPI001C8A5F5E|nr:DUF402 domain-containing protein [Mycoplasma sp. Ms02]QZE12098.1 DUF402 domain-containing protein [Mycoplasma sp. Ms02]
MRFDSLKKIRIGQIVEIQAYKYDGKLYRQWNKAKVIFADDKNLVCFMHKTKVTELENKGWVYREPVIWVFSKKHLFNAIITIKKDGNHYYINLASTPIFEDETIKFIDYDLDVKVYPFKDLKIVDREEFFANSKKFNYPQKLKELIYKQLSDIITMYDGYKYIFDDKNITYYKKLAETDKLLETVSVNNNKKQQKKKTKKPVKKTNMKKN